MTTGRPWNIDCNTNGYTCTIWQFVAFDRYSYEGTLMMVAKVTGTYS